MREIAFSASASVVVYRGDGADQEALYAVSPFPATIRAAPDQIVRVRAAAFDGRGLPAGIVDYRWEVLNRAAGFLLSEEPTERGFFELRMGEDSGYYPRALRVAAVEETNDGVREVTAYVDVTIANPAPPPALAAVEPLLGGVQGVPGQIVRLLGIGYDHIGRVLPETRFEWELADPSLGTLNALGFLTVQAEPGEYDEALLLRGRYRDATVETFIPVTVLEGSGIIEDRITTRILPQRVSLASGLKFQFYAVTYDSRGQPVRTVDVSWEVTDPAAGYIDSDGIFHAGGDTGVFPDAVSYTAVDSTGAVPVTVEAKASITIRTPPEPSLLDSVEVRPASSVLATGRPVIFRAIGRDAGGRRIATDKARWEVLEPRAGSIDETGRFMASETPGLYENALRVTVVQETGHETISRTAGADIVIAGEMVEVTVSPEQVIVDEGDPINFRAEARDVNGFLVPGVVFKWKVVDPAAGSIGPFGTFTAGGEPGAFDGAIEVTAIQRMVE